MTVAGVEIGARLSEITFVVLDLETTGFVPGSDRIIEVGAAKIRGGVHLDTFQRLVQPGVELPPAITELTGITDAMLVGAPVIGEVLPELLTWIGDAVVVGHNLGFDTAFLDAALVDSGQPPLGGDRVDTLFLARRLVLGKVPDMRLATLAAHFDSRAEPTHRALDDALATVDVLGALLERAAARGVVTLEDLHRLPEPWRSRIRRVYRRWARAVSRRCGRRLRRRAPCP